VSLPPLWPSALPLCPDVIGLTGEVQDQVHRFVPEQGLPIARPHQTATVALYRVSFAGMTEAQMSAFWTFFDEDLKRGALPFAWIHPRRRLLREVRLQGPPTETMVGHVRWTLSLAVQFIDITPSWAALAEISGGAIVEVTP
jgi:hypothetical protein